MSLRPGDRERGLASINDARRARRRAIVFGRVRLREVATRFWLFTFAGFALFAVIYYRHAQSELEEQRSALRARQRAVALAAGKEVFVLRDRIESWVQALASTAPSERVSAQASLDAISRGPGIYVRMRQSDALQVDSLRRAASSSLRDGFTSCLFVGRASSAPEGTPCKTKAQCGAGELCDDWGVCSVPSQPYNLRLLYAALQVLGPQWDERLAKTGDELEIRAMELELADTSKHEVPAAVAVVRRSKYFTAVLDEAAAGATPAFGPDAGLRETPEERLQARDHYVRVGIWDLEAGEQLVSLRFEAAGRFVTVGDRPVRDVASARARQRQANNCAAALEVRDALSDALGGVTPVAAVPGAEAAKSPAAVEPNP